MTLPEDRAPATISGLINYAAWLSYPLPDVVRCVEEWCDKMFPHGWSPISSTLTDEQFTEVMRVIRGTLHELSVTEFADRVKDTRERVTLALYKLGARPVDIADYLIEHDFAGKLRNSCECPIANYLRDEVHATAVTVTKDNIQVDGVNVVPLHAVSTFVTYFDQKRYRGLIEPAY